MLFIRAALRLWIRLRLAVRSIAWYARDKVSLVGDSVKALTANFIILRTRRLTLLRRLSCLKAFLALLVIGILTYFQYLVFNITSELD